MRGLSLACLAVLVAGSLASGWVVRDLVRSREQAALGERAAEVNLVLGTVVPNVQAPLDLLATAVRSSNGSPATFAEAAAPVLTAERGTRALALLRVTRDGVVVEMAAGAGLTPGQRLDGERAWVAERALETSSLVPTRVIDDGTGKAVGFALGPPAAPPETTLYREVAVSPGAPTTATESEPFSELGVNLYAAPTPDPSQLVLATSGNENPSGFVEHRQFPVGDGKWLLAVWAKRPLVGWFVAHLPEVVVTVGLLLSLLVFAVVEAVLRRRDYAVALVEERTAELRESVASLELARQEAATARDEAIEASRLKSQFLANMSHEIRTPLNGVIGMTGLLLDTPLDEEQLEFAETARRSGETLLEILNDILDFSKIEAGRLELEISDFDVSSVMDDVVELFGSQARDKGLELVAFTDPDLPRTVSGDPGRLRQVLTNLVSNAVKFTETGEVLVTASAVDGSGSMLRFAVRDTGVGIPPGDHDRLFESFSQADPSTTRRYGGTGLGLAICKRLVQMMGGTIGFESTPGEGSTFWFTARLHPRPELTPRPVERESLTGVRVLVVDDNETNRTILQRQLAAWGMPATAVADGEQALRALLDAAARGALPQLAILDRKLPEGDGVELGRALTAHPELAGLRLILLTSTASHRSVESPFAAVLTKPVRRAQLFQAVASVMGVDPAGCSAEGSTSGGTSLEPGTEGRSGASATTGGPRLLVAEDNPVNQRVAAAMLRRLGYRVDVVGDGREAVEAVSTVPYAAVLMDCQMPEMNGYEAATEIRRLEADDGHTANGRKAGGVLGRGGRRLPIVALTASAVKGDEERCLAAGMDAYVSKPVRIEDLADVLGRVTGDSGQDGRGGGQSDDGDGEAILEPDPTDGWRGARETEPVLDPGTLARLRSLGGGQGLVLRELATLFREGAEEDLRTLKTALASYDLETVGRTAHRLRGSCTAIGATRVARFATQLESRAQDRRVDDLEVLVLAVERSLADVQEVLDAELTRAPVA